MPKQSSGIRALHKAERERERQAKREAKRTAKLAKREEYEGQKKPEPARQK
jgi:hypothetical protein